MATACTLTGVLALAGCGPGEPVDGGPAVREAARSAGGDLDPWLAKVCGAVGSVRTVADERNQLDWQDVSDRGKAAELVTHLRRVDAEIGTALAVLDSVGAPPVERGDTVLTELRESFTERRDAVTDAAEFIEGSASRIDPLAPAQVASAAQAAYTAAPRLARQIERRRELRDAYAANPACRDL